MNVLEESIMKAVFCKCGAKKYGAKKMPTYVCGRRGGIEDEAFANL